jgi:hypothetical protein
LRARTAPGVAGLRPVPYQMNPDPLHAAGIGIQDLEFH